MTRTIYNFNAGPAILPRPVLEEAQRDLLGLPGVGLSVMEISHRSKAFEKIIQEAEQALRQLLGLSADYHVLFLQGGASLQFSMVPMNFLPAGGSADYILTGEWSKKAVKEAAKVGKVSVAGSSEKESFSRIPRPEELRLDPKAAYVHFTSNNTIYGTQWKTEPEVGAVPLVCDASSDILSRPIPVEKYALIYAGAQKNMGPSGVTVVVIRQDLLERVPPGLPSMLDFRLQAQNHSLYNTPPCFAIYLAGLVFKWSIGIGGLATIDTINREKAKVLYDVLDASEFYRGTAERDSRSLMNVTFRLPSEDLEARFVKEATAAGMEGLKGHRSAGGIRASIYNAFPLAGAQILADFMKEFERTNG
ncbi:MAG: 3-phosphoserine/phosphohydroxythreonine transaminase [Acidobacteriota bacterium]